MSKNAKGGFAFAPGVYGRYGKLGRYIIGELILAVRKTGIQAPSVRKDDDGMDNIDDFFDAGSEQENTFSGAPSRLSRVLA